MGGIVYGLLSPSGRTYIGQANRLHDRLYRHEADAIRYRKNHAISRAIRKYGMKNLKVFVLADDASKDWRDFYESLFIHLFGGHTSDGGYNLTCGGDGTCGLRISKEHRRKIANAHRGTKASEQTRKRMSESGKRWWKVSSNTELRRVANAENAKIARAVCVANKRTQSYRPLSEMQREMLRKGTFAAANIVRGSKWSDERRAKVRETWRRKLGH